MALSTVTVTGAWVTAANTPATGQVTIAPVAVAVGAGTIVAGVPVSARLVAGAISVVVVANTQATTLQYRVSEQIDGAANTPDYFITPSGSTLDLSTAPRGTGTAVPLYVLASALGQANGVPTLDGTGKVPLAQLPTSATGVLDVTAADATIVVAGTAQHPTVGVGVIPESKVTNLTTDLNTLTNNVAAKASKPVVRRAYVTTGTAGGDAPPNTAGAWQAYSPTGTLVVPAAVGDYIEVQIAMLTTPSATTFWDVVVMNAAVLQRYLSTGTSTPGTEGDPALAPFSTVRPFGYVGWVDVAAGDINAGNVTFRLAVKSDATGKIYLNTADPFRWRAINYGAVS
jgi:hypothetical protein